MQAKHQEYQNARKILQKKKPEKKKTKEGLKLNVNQGFGMVWKKGPALCLPQQEAFVPGKAFSSTVPAVSVTGTSTHFRPYLLQARLIASVCC